MVSTLRGREPLGSDGGSLLCRKPGAVRGVACDAGCSSASSQEGGQNTSQDGSPMPPPSTPLPGDPCHILHRLCGPSQLPLGTFLDIYTVE